MAIRRIGCEKVVSLAPGPGVEGRRHCIAVGCCGCVVVVVAVCCFGFWSVGVSFISFRGFLGSSKSKFFFDLEFDAKDYFKINTSFVCA